MTGNEAHRQYYLAAAGVRMWYARRPLPGAAPSPEFDFSREEVQSEVVRPEQPEPELQPRVAPPLRSQPARPKSVDLQSLMATPEVDQSLPEPTVPREPVIAEPETPHAPLAAHLGIWDTEKYILISQWSDQASERLQDSLAANLLKALGQQKVGSRRMLHWPVFRNPYIPGNSVEDFRDLLARTIRPGDDRSIILLGVMGSSQTEQRQHCLGSLLRHLSVDFPNSLAELSASPGQKRDLWAALKSRY